MLRGENEKATKQRPNPAETNLAGHHASKLKGFIEKKVGHVTKKKSGPSPAETCLGIREQRDKTKAPIQ